MRARCGSTASTHASCGCDRAIAPITVAVIGATGAAGSTVLRVLEDRRLPVDSVRALASAHSAGTRVLVRGESLIVDEVSEAALRGCALVFLAAGADTARRWAPLVVAGGGVAIDKSSAYRMDPGVPLVVPEVNGALVTGAPAIISNPNCVAIPLTVALAPLRDAFGLRHVTVATYQSVSGGGRDLLHELDVQVQQAAAGAPATRGRYAHILAGNVIPGGWSMHGDDTDEEIKVIEETRRVLAQPDLAVSVTTVRVPVRIGHSAAVWVQCEAPVSAEQARAVLREAPGVRVEDDSSAQCYPTPLQAQGTDAVWVGRVRADLGMPGGIAMFLAVDNLRKGAATNAVQVAELVLAARARGAGPG